MSAVHIKYSALFLFLGAAFVSWYWSFVLER